VRVAGTDVEDLRRFATDLLAVPAGTTPHVKVQRVLDRRRSMLETDQIDWPHAEMLALAQVARSGRKVRLTGQDVVRGTFTQRHATIHDIAGGADHSPLFEHPETGNRARIFRSPLSETAVLGYEYGYSVGSPEALVMWEAQFGDFANGGQVITDQFIAGSRAKWGQRSRLTMLLPHGYDGAGPEHSSARIERFLQLAAEDNMTVAVPTTPAQYHNLLVEQAEHPEPRPLVVFTPKSLLRHKAVVSSLAELAAPHFRPVLGAEVVDPAEIRTVLLCTGKVYYDLAERIAAGGARHVAVVRVERLYPLPVEEIEAELGRFPRLAHVAWVQEEPRNMGAHAHVAQEIAERTGRRLEYVGRPARAATAEGYGSTHRRVQADLVARAIQLGSSA
jgi:2-oxoglutarate dehydrogenase E1 component